MENEPKLTDLLAERDPHQSTAMTEWGKVLREKEPNQLQLDDRSDLTRIQKLILDPRPYIWELSLPNSPYRSNCRLARNCARKPHKRKSGTSKP